MFSRFITLLPIAALAAVAGAAPADGNTAVCTTGAQFCCDHSITVPTTFQNSNNGNLVGVLANLVSNVAVTCSPVTALGLGSGSSCTSQNACCNNNTVNGFVNFVCSPIAVNA